jgi:2-polyprenyl-3-methyl-5-hydroxy-6-metoxy-1,4-benzoquinol methylase
MHILLKENVTESDLQALYAQEIEVLFRNKKTWEGWRYQERFAEVIKFVQRYVPKKSKIIDVGTCQGNFSVRLASEGYITLGLDFKPIFLEYARWKLKKEKPKGMENVNFIVGTASNLPIPSKAFDCVLFLEIVEHLSEPEKALHEVRRILRDDGLLVLSTVKRFWFIASSRSFKEFKERRMRGEIRIDTIFGDEHLFEPKEEELVNLLSSCGFHVLRLETIVPLVLYPILSIRGLNSIPNFLINLLVKILTKLNWFCRSIVVIAKKKKSM